MARIATTAPQHPTQIRQTLLLLTVVCLLLLTVVCFNPFHKQEKRQGASLFCAPFAAEPRITIMSDQIKNVSDASFDADVLKSGQPVLVDYWAAWCGPCKMIAPILEEVATEYAGRLTVAKLNVDENQGTAAKYGIRGIPTLMLFKDGQAAATKVGALSKSQLTAFLDGAL